MSDMDYSVQPHRHKYFVFQVKADFVPVGRAKDGVQVYERVEYSYSGCNCGASLKSRVADYQS